MGFQFVILPSSYNKEWPRLLREAIPGIDVRVCASHGEALEAIEDADAAFGDVTADLLVRAKKLRWVQCHQAGPHAGYYHQALIHSDVVVTNMRGIYSDHIAAHIMAFVLAFSRGMQRYWPQQQRREWKPGAPSIHLPEAAALVVGVGGIGSETARLCAAFGIRVLGVDARRTDLPPGVAELHRPDKLHELLPQADFVIVTVPETPETRGMFAARQFKLMKPTAFLVNIGRGTTVALDDLVAALREGRIAGAGLDVFEREPLPPDHPLWSAPNVLLTPHVAATGPYIQDRRTELFIDNCKRFNEGRPLRNVVDKARWY